MVLPDERPDPNYVPTKTNWFMSSVPAMWHYVNLQLDAHYKQADGWKMASELTSLYHSRLMTYRENFVEGWRNSPAQEAFIAELDKLIKSVENTRDIASSNYNASVDIPSAIWEAKRKLEPIVQAYNTAAGNQAKIDSGQPSTTPSPSASGETPQTPKDIMNDKLYEAAPIMYDLSRNLVRAQQTMLPPSPYVAPGRSTYDDGGGNSGSPNLPPAIVPPIIPPPPPPVVPVGPVTPLPTPTAPDLSGLTPVQPRPPLIGTPPIGPMVPQQPGLISPLPPVAPTGLPVGPSGLRPTLSQPGLPGMPGAGGQRTPSALPPGGMIGGTPGAPGASGARGGARPLPPGGMIGGGTGGRGAGMGAPGAPGMAGRGGPMGGMPGRPGHGQSDEDHEDFDPDTQWHVAQGVTPVVDAPEVPRVINPGPAIGLD